MIILCQKVNECGVNDQKVIVSHGTVLNNDNELAHILQW